LCFWERAEIDEEWERCLRKQHRFSERDGNCGFFQKCGWRGELKKKTGKEEILPPAPKKGMENGGKPIIRYEL